ncbi:putative metal-dependent hydrolase [Paenibacillus mucilaginosus]|uniref:Putative metal-dependent hydrolase KNP414_01019 n=1 Tax=Paenibacillus mucilaginosus (strain KNP414) TaxID=1036673 RepID=F8FAF6_PAEMK|nr:putative metal-dependent hydrolase [Paenibacillus mucilaginosus]AEI39609.1 conserved hypothetical protein [Paenibacillus mucilaginosus KNP414]WDM28553.1 putative metal-dependent hydrolase [Paenibacillus mucilaginosus]
MTNSLISRQFPIGTFTPPAEAEPSQIRAWIDEIERLPSELRAALSGADEKLLNTPYREGGWTVRQVVHHMADSHMNSYVRFKLALTEEEPTIKPYREDRWAELDDALDAPVELSLVLLEQLHARWTLLLRSLSGDQLSRTFRHPESGIVPLYANIGIYAWHGRHHLAHIRLVTGTPAVSKLRELLRAVPRTVRSIPEEDLLRKPAPERWSKHEILGHLCDSAGVNHTRFLSILVSDSPVSLPGYQQDEWVRRNQYQTLFTPGELLDYWVRSNERVLSAVSGARGEEYAKPCILPDGTEATFSWLLDDYVNHLLHHMEQIQEGFRERLGFA